jgi:hypothetical protein
MPLFLLPLGLATMALSAVLVQPAGPEPQHQPALDRGAEAR